MTAAKKPPSRNCALRNEFWAYPRFAQPMFVGAPAVIETKCSHEIPDVASLPEGADVTTEFCGGAYFVWLDGGRRRVYVRRFERV